MSEIQEVVHCGDVDVIFVGFRVVLPSSFVGEFRYMFNNCQDSMSICSRFGCLDLFLTIMCSPKWPEIQRYIDSKGLNAFGCPDILCELFHIKLQSIMNDFKNLKFFGNVIASSIFY